MHGDVDEGYGAVFDAFKENFDNGREVGAACAVYQDGRLVVDVWGGYANLATGAPWLRSTIAPIFSVTKALTSICAQLLRQRGLLEFDRPVSHYWPEFAQAGKDAITVDQLLGHRAGLPVVDTDLTLDDLAAWQPVIHALERQRPSFKPGSGFCYHALTFGWLVGEVIRRVSGLTPGQMFTAEIAEPLGLDLWIGLPATHNARVARLEPPPGPGDPMDSVTERSLTLGGATPLPYAEPEGGGCFNSARLWQLEIPAANAIGTASSIARAFAATVSEIDGVTLFSDATILDCLRVRSAGDFLGGVPIPDARFSSGFLLNGVPLRPLLSDHSFGHDGAGCELGFADAAHRVGFAYINNQMGNGDDRPAKLAEALRSAVRR